MLRIRTVVFTVTHSAWSFGNFLFFRLPQTTRSNSSAGQLIMADHPRLDSDDEQATNPENARPAPGEGSKAINRQRRSADGFAANLDLEPTPPNKTAPNTTAQNTNTPEQRLRTSDGVAPNRDGPQPPTRDAPSDANSGNNPSRNDSSADHEIGNRIDRRLEELDRDREPLSMAEVASVEARQQGQRIGKDENPAVVGQSFSELQSLSTDALRTVAKSLDIPIDESAPTHELIYAILKERLKSNGMMFGEGTLEILPDGFGFLRSSKFHYLSCLDDIYVSPSQIRRFGLETGVTVSGQIRPPKVNERYFALLRIEAINHKDPKALKSRTAFDRLTPLHPDTRILMETVPKVIETRVIDIIAPIGFGQRGLIVSPPRAGKTMLLQKMAKSVLANYPDAFVIVLLIDERPEEVTDMEREVAGPQCEVVSSTFDEPSSRHVQVANMVLEKAKRMVEYGTDVVIFLDSMTRFARAWNSECTQSGKLLSGGVDANALQKPKAFFGSARKVEEGGSLTILATALIDTGSKMDSVIFEEFKGTGNMEIMLDRSMVDKRIWPAIDINNSGTRREEMLFGDDEYERVAYLRRSLSELSPPDAMASLVKGLKKTETNAQFLMSLPVDD
jgi:transcription termination factor Rho